MYTGNRATAVRIGGDMVEGVKALHINTEQDFFAAMYDGGFVGELASLVWTLACALAGSDTWARQVILGGECGECGEVRSIPHHPDEVIRRLVEFSKED